VFASSLFFHQRRRVFTLLCSLILRSSQRIVVARARMIDVDAEFYSVFSSTWSLVLLSSLSCCSLAAVKVPSEQAAQLRWPGELV
jgi:hypothetical protein